MEEVGYEPGVVQAHIHTAKYNHLKNTSKGERITIADASEAFHVYAVEWDKEQMDFYVDDKKYFTYRNQGSGSGGLAVRQGPVPDPEPGHGRLLGRRQGC